LDTLTNEQILDAAKQLKNNVDNLASVALEPANDLQIIQFAAGLSKNTGRFMSDCLDIAASKLMVSDGWETNR
jgi:hypothetical protein